MSYLAIILACGALGSAMVDGSFRDEVLSLAIIYCATARS
jgi:hypothetical protein